MIDLPEMFEKHHDARSSFGTPEGCPDLIAFNLLNKLAPVKDGHGLISCSEHDEFFLATDCKKLAEVATEEDIIMLRRCGIRYDSSLESLCMFV